MEQTAIELYTRSSGPDSIIHHLREDGLIPGVLYGQNHENQLVQIDERELKKQIKMFGKSGIFYVTIEGGKIPVKINEVQRNPVDRNIIHVDLQRVELNKPVIMDVPIQFFGSSIGEKSGGVLQQQLRSIELRGLPSSIPSSIQVNISDLDIGKSIQVKDIYIPEVLEVNHDLDSVVVRVLAPRMAEQEEMNEEPSSEPEIVGDKNGPGIDAAK